MLETEFVLKEETKKELSATIYWSKYAAILSIISIGIGVFQFIIGLSTNNKTVFSTLFPFIISSVISLILAINLMKYSKLIKSGMNTQKSSDINQAFYFLRNYFIIMGVLFVIALALVLIGILISILIAIVK